MTDEYSWYGSPEPFNPSAETRFFQIATMAHDRFCALPAYDTAIEIVPLPDDGSKRPTKGFLPNLHAVTKSDDGILLAAAVYPDANVGIRGRSEVGGIIVIDIDEPGTIERIERDYGPLPLTYTTLTRPVTKPYKHHIYMMQTEYLLKAIQKQITDVTHIAGYDLKCGGGWGYVAAEGSVRDGETITALYDDAPIAPIPDSLVDWLVADIAKARAMKIKKSKPAPSPATTEPHPAAVARIDRHWVIASRIRTWKNTGIPDDVIFDLLVQHIRQYFEDSEQMLTPAYTRKLRAMIHKVPTLGERSYRNLTHHRRHRRRTSIPLSTIRERFKSAPLDITATNARRFFSVKNAADHKRMLRELHRHGYLYLGRGSHSGIWTRPAVALLSSSSPSSSIKNSLSPRRYPLSLIRPSSSIGKELCTTHAAPHHKRLSMNTNTFMDQQVASKFLMDTEDTEKSTASTKKSAATAEKMAATA